eukprot:comp9998_c0_seq1/m.4874 comp9998_c0_seq1/g.4874  ORF comp9998_c0_seq1/g.4874 comp9998_c0_seq1/m.4874 type:complete len:133 (+) comp9998_c0_seq1:478-876(+)
MEVPQALLARICPVFNRMFESQCVEATTLHVNVETFRQDEFDEFLRVACTLEAGTLELPLRFTDKELSAIIPIPQYYMCKKVLAEIRNFVTNEPSLDRVLMLTRAGVKCPSSWSCYDPKSVSSESVEKYYNS